MELKLIRKVFTEHTTMGDLFVNGVYECHILEDKDRELTQSMSIGDINRAKVYGKTCIPYGKYRVIITKSESFSTKAGHDVYLPLIMNVPGYSGIRIHKGNTEFDTYGCLLPCKIYQGDKGYNSTEAWNALNDKINHALKAGEEVTIEITK